MTERICGQRDPHLYFMMRLGKNEETGLCNLGIWVGLYKYVGPQLIAHVCV